MDVCTASQMLCVIICCDRYMLYSCGDVRDVTATDVCCDRCYMLYSCGDVSNATGDRCNVSCDRCYMLNSCGDASNATVE